MPELSFNPFYLFWSLWLLVIGIASLTDGLQGFKRGEIRIEKTRGRRLFTLKPRLVSGNAGRFYAIVRIIEGALFSTFAISLSVSGSIPVADLVAQASCFLSGLTLVIGTILMVIVHAGWGKPETTQ